MVPSIRVPPATHPWPPMLLASCEGPLSSMGSEGVHVTFLPVKTCQLTSQERDIPSFPGFQQSVFLNPFSNTADSFKMQTKSYKQENVGCCWCVSCCGLGFFWINHIHSGQRRKVIVIQNLPGGQTRDLCHHI